VPVFIDQSQCTGDEFMGLPIIENEARFDG